MGLDQLDSRLPVAGESRMTSKVDTKTLKVRCSQFTSPSLSIAGRVTRDNGGENYGGGCNEHNGNFKNSSPHGHRSNVVNLCLYEVK